MRKQRALRLSEQLEVEDALRDAYAPLRSRRVALSPLRARAAVRWGRGRSERPVRWAHAVSRLSELSVAAGMSVMIFVGALGPAPARVADPVDEARDPAVFPAPRASVALDDVRFIRSLRIERSAPVQDRLDPALLHAGSARAAQRLEAPAPAAPATPNEPS